MKLDNYIASPTTAATTNPASPAPRINTAAPDAGAGCGISGRGKGVGKEAGILWKSSGEQSRCTTGRREFMKFWFLQMQGMSTPQPEEAKEAIAGLRWESDVREGMGSVGKGREWREEDKGERARLTAQAGTSAKL